MQTLINPVENVNNVENRMTAYEYGALVAPCVCEADTGGGVVTTLAQVYAKLPGIKCKGLCAEACGPIQVSDAELTAINSQRMVDVPSEPIGGGWHQIATLSDYTCVLLERGRCSVYENRPMICRLWGMVQQMPCEWGCKPDRVISDYEGGLLLNEARDAR